MKLRVKATGETLEIPQDSFVCGVRPDGNDVEFMVQEVEIIPDYWDAFRREAAKDIIPAVLSCDKIMEHIWSLTGTGKNPARTQEMVVNVSIKYANELIRQLKEVEK